jgi:DNA-binding NarL/FixJ family response regulator
MIRVLLADDEELIRVAIAALLGLEPDLEVVAQAADGRAAVAAALAHRPDVAVVDLRMPGLDGIEVAAELRRVLPSCAVVVLTVRDARPSCRGLWPPAPRASCRRARPAAPWPTSYAACTPAAATSTRRWPPTP